MRRQQHTFILFAIMAVMGLFLNLSGQVAQPFTGQTKADLISAAFSSYLSGDISQARQYLNRASQIDMEDVTIRRLLENLAPVPVPQPVIPIPTTPPVPVALSTPSLSASEQARLIARQNGLSDAAINAALQPPPVAFPSVSSIPTPPPLPPTTPGIGKLDFSGFRENPRSLPPSILPSPSVVPSVTAPDPLAAFPNHLGNLPQVSPMSSPSATMPAAGVLASRRPLGTSNVSQQLADKQQESDNLISQITQASIALSQAMQTGDVIQVQAREAELANFRNQLKIVDASVVQLKLANQAALSTSTGSAQAAASAARTDLIT
ncbi:MAG: hypothetical protein OSA95_11595, partial [Opitutales bacterium]|nr:hypothetical protein [Opitutales bacterium]